MTLPGRRRLSQNMRLSIRSMMTVAVVVKMMMLLERACLRLVEGFRLLPVWYALLRIPSVTTA